MVGRRGSLLLNLDLSYVVTSRLCREGKEAIERGRAKNTHTNTIATGARSAHSKYLGIKPGLPPIADAYITPARGISYTFQSPNGRKAQYRLDYILTRQVDRRLVRNVSVWTLPRENAETDHNLVIANILFLARIAPNRPKIVVKNRRAIDLPRLMADPHLQMNLQNAIAANLASPTPGTNAGSVDDMASLLTETLL